MPMKPTRLQKHRQHQWNNKITMLVGVLVFLIVFFFTGSIWFFSAVGSFIAKTSNSTATETDMPDGNKEGDDDIVASVSIDNIPEATNEARIVVSGEIQTYDTVTFFINGKEVGETKAKSNGTFRKEVGPLQPGENTVFVRSSSSKLGIRENSQKHTTTYLNKEPILEVTEPSNGTTTSTYDITVVGTTDVDNTVYVNGAPTVVDAEGSFRSSVRLNNGDNEITVVARDKADNETETVLTVKREDD